MPDKIRPIADTDMLVVDDVTGAVKGIAPGGDQAKGATFGGTPGSSSVTVQRYLGQFSSGSRLPTAIFGAATGTQVMARARYISRNTVSNPQFAWPNWAVVSNNGGLETGTGGAATITAALEYNGVAYPITWDGASSTSVADLATSTLCDPVPITIPKDAAYFIRTYVSNASGFLCEGGATNSESQDAANGEAFRWAVSGLADQTNATGGITGGTSNTTNRYGPILHVANITAPSVLIVGTSIQMGFRETALGGLGFGDKGVISRCVGPYFGYANIAQGGASVTNFLTAGTSTLRQALQKYFTHVITDHGVNDILNANINAPVIASRLTQMAALFPGKSLWVTTCLPRTSGAWTLADGSDQTAYTLNQWNTRRTALNDMIKSGIGGYAGHFDLSSAAELPGDSTKWYADGSTNFMFGPYTPADGLHPGRAGGERIRASGAFDPTKIVISL